MVGNGYSESVSQRTVMAVETAMITKVVAIALHSRAFFRARDQGISASLVRLPCQRVAASGFAAQR